MSLKDQAGKIRVPQSQAAGGPLLSRNLKGSSALSSTKSATHEAPGVSSGEFESSGSMLSFIAADEARQFSCQLR